MTLMEWEWSDIWWTPSPSQINDSLMRMYETMSDDSTHISCWWFSIDIHDMEYEPEIIISFVAHSTFWYNDPSSYESEEDEEDIIILNWVKYKRWSE